MKTLAIIGSGYVGVTTAAIAANCGFKVHLIDIDEDKVKTLQSGRSFFYEEGVDPLIQRAVKNGLLLPSTSYDGVAEAEIVFSCVGTPDNPDGSSNLEHVFTAAKTAAQHLSDGAIYVQKSTVPVGTGSKVTKLLPDSVLYVSNPEFLREGTAVHDSLFFDRVVVGGNEVACKSLLELYKAFEKNRDSIARQAGVKTSDTHSQYISTGLESAELIKVASNAFLALKISFANSMAKLSDQTNADVVEVMEAVGADTRIGRAFFNAGKGYGGGCFPKDVSGLITSAAEHGVDMPIMVAATDVNDSMPGYIAEKAREALGTLDGRTVAVLGLAFKPGTSDARRSPGVALANILAKSGAKTRAYDPHANQEAQADLKPAVTLTTSMSEATDGVDAVFIATDWPEFLSLDPSKLKSAMNGTVFVDATNRFEPSKITDAGLQYIGVGRKA